MPNKYVPPLLQDAIVLGFWGAATVKVFGYTWESVKSTWSEIGGVGTSPAATAIAKQQPSHGIIHGITTLNPFEVVRGIAGALGVGVKTKVGSPLGQPTAYATLTKAIRDGNRNAAIVSWNQVVRNYNAQLARQGQPQRGDLAAALLLHTQGFYNSLHNLTGITVDGFNNANLPPSTRAQRGAAAAASAVARGR